MKPLCRILRFVLVLQLSALPVSRAQVTCDQFCIDDISLDTVPGIMNLTITLSGDSSTFINYPYPEAVVDQNGDTIGNGSMFFFGQFGNSTSVYPCSTSLTLIPPGFEATILFRYDTLTCLLPYPCIIQSIGPRFTNPVLSVFPIPATDQLMVALKEAKSSMRLQLMDTRGVIVRDWNLVERESVLDIHGIAAGIYFLRTVEGDAVRVVIE